jgi:hypothetical protein
MGKSGYELLDEVSRGEGDFCIDEVVCWKRTSEEIFIPF